jgi:Electron transfer DM13
MIKTARLLLLGILVTACATSPAETQTLPTPAPAAVVIAATEAATPLPGPTEALIPPTKVTAPTTTAATVPVAVLEPLTFVKMEVGVQGGATVDPAAGQVVLSDDFNISTGPDLFVILSSASNLGLDYVAFSEAVTAAPILYLGELITTSGAQSYTIPAGTDLSQYNSVIVWCRQYSVAFAAAAIR